MYQKIKDLCSMLKNMEIKTSHKNYRFFLDVNTNIPENL